MVAASAAVAFFAVVPARPEIDLFLVVSGMATAVPVVLARWWPLPAWLVLVAMVLFAPLVYGPHVDLVRAWGWPWTMGLALGLAYILYVVAETAERRVLVPVAVVTALAAGPHLPDWRDLSLVTVLVAGVLGFGDAVRMRRVAERRRLAERARTVALEERTRIARELHDVVSHHMSALVLRADAVTYRFPDLPPEVRAEFALLHRMARDGLVETRHVLTALRAPDDAAETAPQPGADDVAGMVESFRATGTPITLRTDFAGLPAAVGLSAYRIVQEALSNCARHAPGGAVTIDLVAHQSELLVSIVNTPGVRPASDTDPHRPRHGLVGMAERVRVLDGAFDAGPTDDGGFTVTARLPLRGLEDG
ncbi:histidine kinase [Saccharothrix violaceirubra]